MSTSRKRNRTKLAALAEQHGGVDLLAKEVGVSDSSLKNWLRGGMPFCGQPLDHNIGRGDPANRKRMCRVVLELCELSGCTPEELFPGYVRAPDREVKAAPAVRQLSLKRAFALPARSLDHELPPDELAELRERIKQVLSTLSYREREIIKLRYGLLGYDGHTLTEVGRIFKVTRERVKQIEKKAIWKLRQPSRSVKLKNFYDERRYCE